MQQATFSRNMLQRLNTALGDLEVDIDAVARRLSRDRGLYDGERPSRVLHNHDDVLWQALEAESGDPFLGLHTGVLVGIQRGGMALEYLFLSCPTFGDALGKSQNYTRLLSDALRTEVRKEGNVCIVRFWFVDDKLTTLRHINEMTLAGFFKFFQYVTGGDFKALWVAMRHAKPQGDDSGSHDSEYQRVLQCPVRFGESHYAIAFDASVLERVSLMPEPTLYQLHQQVIDRQMAEMEREALAHKVRDIIAELLPLGDVGFERVAEHLDMRPSQLRYQLAEVGTNFSQLLSEYRLELAKHLLANTELSIDEILLQTGFSEPSPFYRAFKRGTGVTPVAYRDQHKGGGRAA
jgi:AraC-like DNA-binding protein